MATSAERAFQARTQAALDAKRAADRAENRRQAKTVRVPSQRGR